MGKAASTTLAVLTFAIALGCKKQEEQPPPGYGAPPPQQGYPQQQPGQPPAQPGYGQQPPPPAPAGTVPAPAPAGTAPAGQMSQPNAMAFPCQTDAQCFTHRCNTQFGKCAWPCQTDADCTPGNKCVAPQCVPGQ